MSVPVNNNVNIAINNTIEIFHNNNKHELIFTEKDIQKYFELELFKLIPEEHFKYVHQEFPTPIVRQNSKNTGTLDIKMDQIKKKNRGHFDFVYLSENHFTHCTKKYHPALQAHCENIEKYYRSEFIIPIDIIIEFKFGRFQTSALKSKAAGIIASDIVRKDSSGFVSGLAWDVIKLFRSRPFVGAGFHAYWLVFEECGNSFNQIQNEIRIKNIESEINNMDKIDFKNGPEEIEIARKVLIMFLDFFKQYQPNITLSTRITVLEWLEVKYITRISKY
jgi:hypothetical protein